MSWEGVVAAVSVLLLLALVLSWSASRLDHLHGRVERSRATLDAELLRRSASALELAGSGVLDPSSALVLADAAHAARTASSEVREATESALTEALLVIFPGVAAETTVPAPTDGSDLERAALRAQLEEELGTACRRVVMARRLLNESVRVTRVRRRSPVVRYLRLAGRAPMPQTMDFDDRVPQGLASPA